MDIQLIIVVLVGLIVSYILIRGIYRFFFTDKNSSGVCGSCNMCEFNPQNAHKRDA